MSRTDWTDLALRVLAEEGPDSLTVATLCDRAGRTRGSLYHHFADHGALLEATVAAWSRQGTDALVEATPPGPGAADRLNDLALAIDVRVEQGIRRLAERAPAVREAVGAVDRARVEHLARLHAADGDPPDEARARAEVEYAAFLGFQQLGLEPDHMARLYRWFAARGR